MNTKVQKLYSTLDEFTRSKFRIEQKIYHKICDLIQQELPDQNLTSNPEFLYEKTAFAFIESNIEKDKFQTTWENYYRPSFIYKGNDGKIITHPDIKDIFSETIDYWEKRSSEVQNPILQNRYSGLVWFFSKQIKQTNPDISFAHKFIDSSLQLSEIKNENSYVEGFKSIITKLEKSLKLAASISDQDRIFSIRDSLIKYEDAYSEDNKLGTWGYAFDLLIEDKNLSKKIQLTKKQEKKIIEELERRLKIFSDQNSDKFNFFAVEKIISKLASYYKYKGNSRNLKKVLLLYRNSCLYHCKNISAMVGSELLQKVRIILYQYKLFREAENLESVIRDHQRSSLKELKKNTATINISQKEIDNYKSALLNKNSLFESLITLSISFIPDKNRSKEIALKVSQGLPLTDYITQTIIDHTGRVINKIESMEEDLHGHIINQMNREISTNLNWLELGLQFLKTHKSLNVQNLSEHFFLSPIFPKERHQIIKKGLEHFFNKDYISSCLILILQIESIVRKLVKMNEGVIYKLPNFQLRPLGSLLKDEKFITAFKPNKNIPRYFELLLTDQRGWNLRNTICHGHFPENFLNSKVAAAIIHILLILSSIRIKHGSNQKNEQKQF